MLTFYIIQSIFKFTPTKKKNETKQIKNKMLNFI